MRVRALQNIWHNAAAHAAGEAFDVSDALAEQLRQAGLVEIIISEPQQVVEEPQQVVEEKLVEAEPVKRPASRKRSKK